MEKHKSTLLICLLFALAFSTQAHNLSYIPNMDSLTTDLTEYRWKNRLFLIFSPNSNNFPYTQQVENLEGETAELDDRDMLVFHFFADGSGMLNDTPIRAKSVERIYQQYAVGQNDFAVILIGKDGGEKLRKLSVVSMRDIYALIDSMPMRRREMRENSGQD